jgi:hypothetical protein
MGRPPFSDIGPTGRGHQTPRAMRYAAGIGRQLRPQHIDHAPRNQHRLTYIFQKGAYATLIMNADEAPQD